MSGDNRLAAVGTPAPWVSGITDHAGAPVDLQQFAGQHVLLYWYPKDDTPGCTIEACNFRDHGADIDGVILGVSLDDSASHQSFREKFDLPFPLLVDPEGALGKLYGAIIPERANPRRVSFLIDPAGTIKHVWETVDPETHWQEVAAAIQAE